MNRPSKNAEYYVYVYIDPRNYEEFYYGKGKGSRKDAHLKDDSDSEKAKRIKDILNEGLKPIIKVIACELTEDQALLVEKTLIWKLGRNLANISSGHFAANFRPHNKLHQDLHRFDFRNGLYYVNVGEGDHRCWEDCRHFGFLSAGQGFQWSNPFKTFEPGDIVVAYLKHHGYVGIGRVLERAAPINDFKVNGKSLRSCDLKQRNIFDHCDNDRLMEFPVKVEWIKSVESKQAKWRPKAGLFTTPQVKASLQDQPATRSFLEKEFGVSFDELLLAD